MKLNSLGNEIKYTNKEEVLEVVKQNGWSLEYASDDLRNDKEVVLEAVKNYGSSLYYASKELKDDKEFILECVKQNGFALEFASRKLQDDKEIVLKAVSDHERGMTIIDASERLQKDLNIVLMALKNGNAFTFDAIDKDLKDEFGNEENIFIKNIKKEIRINKKIENLLKKD